MDYLRLLGFSLIGVSVFKLAMTPLVRVRSDPVNLTITLSALGLGSLVVIGSLAVGRNPRRRAIATGAACIICSTGVV